MARFTVLMVAAFTASLAASCTSALAVETAVKKILPARVEATSDAKIMKVTLTPKAAERLGIVIDEVRHRRARPQEVYVDIPITGVGDGTDRLLSRMEMMKQLRRLSPEHRTILVEVFYRGSTTKEAADELKIPHGTAKSRLHYGLRHLREGMEVSSR